MPILRRRILWPRTHALMGAEPNTLGHHCLLTLNVSGTDDHGYPTDEAVAHLSSITTTAQCKH